MSYNHYLPQKVDLTPKRHHGFQVVLFFLGWLLPPLGELLENSAPAMGLCSCGTACRSVRPRRLLPRHPVRQPSHTDKVQRGTFPITQSFNTDSASRRRAFRNREGLLHQRGYHHRTPLQLGDGCS